MTRPEILAGLENIRAAYAKYAPIAPDAVGPRVAVLDAALALLRSLPERPDSRIYCCRCAKSVSTSVPMGTIVRAWVECPECIEKQPPELDESTIRQRLTIDVMRAAVVAFRQAWLECPESSLSPDELLEAAHKAEVDVIVSALRPSEAKK